MKLGEIFKGPFKESREESERTIEEAKIGRFVLSEEEKEKIKMKALLSGQDPEEALTQALAKMENANARLRGRASERAIKEIENELKDAV